MAASQRMASPHPGSVLRERVFAASGISIAQAARDLGVTRQALHRLLSGATRITPEMAIRLGRFCGVDGAFWLNLQHQFDLTHAEHVLGAALNHIPTHAGLADRLLGQAGARQISVSSQIGIGCAHEKALLQALVEQATEYAIFTFDLAGRINSWNTGAEHVLGWQASEALGMDARKIFTLDDQASGAPEEEMAITLAKGRKTSERWHVRKDGTRFWATGSLTPLCNVDDGVGSPASQEFVKVLRDRTDQWTSKAQQERLHEADARVAQYAAVLGQVAEGVIVADAAGRIIYVNDAASRIHGTTQLDVFPDAYSRTYRLLTEDNRIYPSTELPLARAVLRGKTVTEARWRIRRPDGSEVLAVGSARPLRTADGMQSGAVLTLRDETARDAAEQALRASEERFRGVFDQQFQFMVVLSPDGITLEINELPLRIACLTREEVIGRPFWETPFWDGMPAMRQAWPRRLAEAARTDGPVLSEDLYQAVGGEVRTADAAVTAVKSSDGAVRFFVIQASDTTARRQAENALRESEARLRLAAEAVGLGIWDVDLESEEGIGTPRVFEIYGLPTPPSGKAQRATFRGLMHPDDIAAVQAEHERTAREGDSFHLTHRIHRSSDKVERWVEVHGRHFQQGGRRRFLAVLTDVTERKAAEERQVLLAREVDHRAKNALAVVQATLRLTSKEDAASYARAVEGRVNALARAQTLLAEDRWSGADLHALVAGELAPFISGQQAELGGPSVVLPAGATQPIAMALHELATNALKHGALSVPEGRVSVVWRLDPANTALQLHWTEAGGPAVMGPPERRGFGMRVLEGTVRGQLGGVVSIMWDMGGLVCDMEVPLARWPDSLRGR
jgi:addiction module HigA family antidote